jgi:hypothetical protein
MKFPKLELKSESKSSSNTIVLRAMAMVMVMAFALSLFGAATAQAEPFTFALLPASGEIAGVPGSTIGWGYTLSNPGDDWLVITGLDADAFTSASPDASIFDFPILAPGTTVTMPYDAIAFRGLFQITWDLNAPPGTVNVGTFVLHADFFDGDPFAGGLFLAAADDQSAAYRASVETTAVVPEPGTLILCLTGLALAAHCFSLPQAALRTSRRPVGYRVAHGTRALDSSTVVHRDLLVRRGAGARADGRGGDQG